MSARHCAACRRFKGVSVEVHHLIPKRDGGEDTLENAIVLCYECHEFAGADYYSARHPKGSKYTVEELRRSRDHLHRAVASGDVSTHGEPPWLDVRYLVLGDYPDALNVLSGNTEALPLAETLVVVPNAVRDFQISLRGPTNTRSAIVEGWVGRSEQSYVADHPDAVPLSSQTEAGDFFTFLRAPTNSDVSAVADLDPLTAQLRNAGMGPDELLSIRAASHTCDGALREIITLRHLLPVVALLRNTSDRPVRLTALRCSAGEASGTEPHDGQLGTDETTVSLPNVLLDPGWTAIVPVMTMTVAPADGPLEAGEVAREVREQFIEGIPYAEVALALDDLSDALAEAAPIGPYLLPTSVEMSADGTSAVQGVHGFDPERTYLLSETLLLGSCPHAFAVSGERCWYLGEVLHDSSRSRGETELDVRGVDMVLISEIEDQWAHIEWVELDGERTHTDMRLERGSSTSVATTHAQTLRIAGMYSAADVTAREHLAARKLAQSARVVASALRDLRLDTHEEGPAGQGAGRR